MTGFSGRKILVTGATGLIGRELVKRLLDAGSVVRTTSTRKQPSDFPDHTSQVEHFSGDLTDRCFADKVIAGVDGLFHLAGRRGSVGIQTKQGATMLAENLLICTNTLEAARRAKVKDILYTSTVSVYPPVDLYKEDLVWTANPHPADQYAAWAKRMAEKLIEAYQIQYGLENIAIVRPVNTFGPHDNFDPKTALVVPALINRVLSGENPFVVWGDGSAVRDFLYVSDVVDGMLLAFEKGAGKGAFNLGSGRGYTIREVVDSILEVSGMNPEVKWDTTKPSGEARKVADITRAKTLLGFSPKVSLKNGIRHTVSWFKKQQSSSGKAVVSH